MVDGRGHLTLQGGSGMAVTSSLPSHRFGKVIVKFARPKDRGNAPAVPATPAELVPRIGAEAQMAHTNAPLV